MSKSEFEIGSSTVEGFFAFINERHRIYVKRFEEHAPWPWTDDPILRKFKFTNVFRQLDRGTIALTEMFKRVVLPTTPGLDLFNVVWYRFFNWHELATEIGYVCTFDYLKRMITKRAETDLRLFTGAHMTSGRSGEEKYETYLEACENVWRDRDVLAADILMRGTMEQAFESMKAYYQVGPFVGYEMVCDFRFLLFPTPPRDRLAWANVGPGAKRGLQRLNLPPTLQSMLTLFECTKEGLASHVARHLSSTRAALDGQIFTFNTFDPPLELREIEHCLCEFDKYERVRLGQGRPRSKYRRPA